MIVSPQWSRVTGPSSEPQCESTRRGSGLLESRTVLADSGIGCTHSSLFDTSGHLGWSAQSLIVEARS